MKKYGLIGYPISHSFSPGYFAEKFEKENIAGCQYTSYPIPTIESFLELKQEGLSGLNVTIPYKEQVIPYLDTLSPDAAEIGAVNTIKFQEDKCIGYNSDVYGFKQSLINWIGLDKLPTHALILGSGGASKAVRFVLNQLDMDFRIVSRKEGYLNYNDIDKLILDKYHLIINTTPLGMSPQIDAFPDLDYTLLDHRHYCYDLIYNPEETKFMQKSAEHGSQIKNGYEMLILQAEKSWEIWNT